MERKGKIVVYLTLLVAVAAAVTVAGCTGSKTESSTLSGKDIFDPAKFSLAKYDVTLNVTGNVSHRQFLVLTSQNEKDGDRITSEEIDGSSSVRTDVWINRERTVTPNVVITAINSTNIMVTGGYPPFNMTTADKAWNPLEATYTLTGKASVETPAGKYENCSVYQTDRQLGYGDTFVTTRVTYYIHPSEPVPVRYVIEMPSAAYEYDLAGAYGPNDRDSTPERVIQAFFSSLEQGDTDSAASYVVTYDGAEAKYKPLAGSSYQDFLQGAGVTYGNSTGAMHVQYVLTAGTTPAERTGGKEVVTARWSSVQYQYEPLYAYDLEGSFNVVNIGGHWKLVG